MTPYRGLVVVVDRPQVGHESLDGIPDHEDGGVAVPKTAIQVHEAPHSPHGPLVSATPPWLAKYHAIVLRVGLEPLFDVRRLHIFIEKCVLALYPALRLEKLLYIGLSRSSNGYFKPLLDPAVSGVKRLQTYNGFM